MPTRKISSTALLRLGFIALLTRPVLYTLIDRTGRSTDLTDFAEGVVLGVAAAAILIVAWRKGRGERIKSCNS